MRTKLFVLTALLASAAGYAQAETITCTPENINHKPECARVARALVRVPFKSITIDTGTGERSASVSASGKWDVCAPHLLTDDQRLGTTVAKDRCGADALPVLARGGYVTVPTGKR